MSDTVTTTDWLSDVERAAWVPLLSPVMWLPSALDIQLERDADVGHFEFAVLAILFTREGGSMRMADLARNANSTLSRLSKVVSRLSEKGWVERRPDLEDGRTTLAALTAAGFEKVIATAPGHSVRVRELVFNHLTSAEVEQLAAIMSKISAATGLNGAYAPRFG